MPTMANCPYCGKLTDPNLDTCVHCGGFLKKGPARPQKPVRKTSQTCPNCGALVQEGDIICVACGTNLLTGQKIAEERPITAGPERNWLPWIIGGVVAVVLLVLVLLVAFWLTRDVVAKAERLSAEGRVLEAMSLLDVYLAKRPDSARAQFAMGKLRWGNGEFDRAAEAFERAAKLEVRNEEAMMLAAIGYATSAQEPAQSRAVTLLEQQVARVPQDHEARYLLALALGAQGQTSRQIEALEKVLELRPAAPIGAAAQLALGVARALDGDYAAGETALAEARVGLGREPDFAIAAGSLASLQGDRDEALFELAAAAQGDPNVSAATLTQVGLLLLIKNRFGEADQYFKRVLERDRNDRMARFFHGICLNAQRLSREALAEFDELSRAEGAFAAEASVEAARIYLEANEIGSALEATDRALRLGAKTALLHTIRGRIHVRNGELDRAREQFRAAIGSDPLYPPAHLENGLLYIQQARINEGIQELERYLELVDPNSPNARADEIRVLVNQLRRTVSPPRTGVPSSSPVRGRVGA